MNFTDRIKNKLWHYIYRFFHKFQTFLLKYKIIRKNQGRQEYHIGWLAPNRTLEELKAHLHSNWGFGNHFVAWIDEGQVLSWRKLIDFNHQYHLRVFNDREIRGHMEYTPEGHPMDHFFDPTGNNRKEDFLKFLGDYCYNKKTDVKLEIDPEAFDPKSEITIDVSGQQ